MNSFLVSSKNNFKRVRLKLSFIVFLTVLNTAITFAIIALPGGYGIKGQSYESYKLSEIGKEARSVLPCCTSPWAGIRNK